MKRDIIIIIIIVKRRFKQVPLVRTVIIFDMLQ